jgi:hypothetical protein
VQLIIFTINQFSAVENINKNTEKDYYFVTKSNQVNFVNLTELGDQDFTADNTGGSSNEHSQTNLILNTNLVTTSITITGNKLNNNEKGKFRIEITETVGDERVKFIISNMNGTV